MLVLLVDPVDPAQLQDVESRAAGRRVVLLDLDADVEAGDIDPGWTRLECRQLFSPTRFRNDYFDFLNSWPNQMTVAHRSFDDQFRTCDGYSVWFTSVAALRSSSRGWACGGSQACVAAR